MRRGNRRRGRSRLWCWRDGHDCRRRQRAVGEGPHDIEVVTFFRNEIHHELALFASVRLRSGYPLQDDLILWLHAPLAPFGREFQVGQLLDLDLHGRGKCGGAGAGGSKPLIDNFLFLGRKIGEQCRMKEGFELLDFLRMNRGGVIVAELGQRNVVRLVRMGEKTKEKREEDPSHKCWCVVARLPKTVHVYTRMRGAGQ